LQPTAAATIVDELLLVRFVRGCGKSFGLLTRRSMIAIPRDAPKTLAWIGVAAHLCVGFIVLRRSASLSTHRLLPMLNLSIALCVLAYWSRVWYAYAMRGVTWYATDQLVPLYAAVVAIASILHLAGRYDGRLAHSFQWLVFGVDALTFIVAALYLTFLRFDRMI
jgi:hypothetical protein